MRLDDPARSAGGIEMTNTIDRELAGCELDRVSGGSYDILPSSSWAVLGAMNGQDIEAIAFLVVMQAAKAAQEDIKAIMGSRNHPSRVRH
jgi:hypothetical protein